MMEELGVSKRKDGVSPEKVGVYQSHLTLARYPRRESRTMGHQCSSRLCTEAQWDEDKNWLLCGNRWISAQEPLMKEYENRWQEHNEHK